MYGNMYESKDCVDGLLVRESEHTYECINSSKLYNCTYCQECNNSHNLHFCYQVNNSHDCFGCVGKINQQYSIFNISYDKETYFQKLDTVRMLRKEEIQKEMNILIEKHIAENLTGYGNENVL